jgi:hypothetical protein
MRAGYGLLLTLLTAGLVACTSPEATRTRGGGPGADIGNRGPVVQMHEGADPYYKTPCLTFEDVCTEPLPMFARATSGHD